MTPLGRLEIRKELIIVERAKFRTQVHRGCLWERRRARQPQSPRELEGEIAGAGLCLFSSHYHRTDHNPTASDVSLDCDRRILPQRIPTPRGRSAR